MTQENGGQPDTIEELDQQLRKQALERVSGLMVPENDQDPRPDFIAGLQYGYRQGKVERAAITRILLEKGLATHAELEQAQIEEYKAELSNGG